MIGIVLLALTLVTNGCKKKTEEDNWTAPYVPSFLANGVKYTASGYSFLYFDIKCTSDAIEVTSVSVVGPYGSSSYSGGGETFSQNQSFYLYDENNFFYQEGKFTFTITGVIRSGAHSGETFTKSTSWELIIP